MSGTITRADLDKLLDESMISARIEQHDDPDHPDANTVEDVVAAFEEIQGLHQLYLPRYTEYYDVVYEDTTVVIYETGPHREHFHQTLDEAAITDEQLIQILDGLMHDIAREYVDRDWSSMYPLVVRKNHYLRAGERHARGRIGALATERGGLARAVDYWATKVQGLTFKQWSRESGRSTGAIGNSIRRGNDHDPASAE